MDLINHTSENSDKVGVSFCQLLASNETPGCTAYTLYAYVSFLLRILLS